MNHILIVDDNAENRYLLRSILQGNGYRVEEANHGAEALLKARQSHPSMIVSDLLMPVMDGYTLLRQCRLDEQLRRVPFVVHTATYTNPKDEQLAIDMGADAFILKPSEPEMLLRQLREILSRDKPKSTSSEQTSRPDPSPSDSASLYRDYNEVLIRKLEQKCRQLEEANEQLRRDMAERQELEEQLRQSQKMEAVGQLAGGIAHDFNNLLTVIHGYTDFALDHLEPSHPSQEYLAEIRRAGERAETLTRQLLAFSRQQMLDPRVLNLNDIISDTKKLLERLIGENIDLTTSLDPAVGLVRVDSVQIEQLLLNLAVNARDAMPRGGRLTISTGTFRWEPGDRRDYLEWLPGDYVELRVEDTGCGMTKEILSRVFEPFFTTKRLGKGTGLGLATVHGIVKQLRGQITVSSQPGIGSTFRVYFPVALEEEECVSPGLPAASEEPLGTGLPTGHESILLAEDEESVRNLARQVLLGCGYQVHEAANGEEALRWMETRTEPIHLLVSDIVMPQVDGYELAKRIKERHPECKVLLISGYAMDWDRIRSDRNVDFSFLPKPFTPTVLAQEVRHVLDR